MICESNKLLNLRWFGESFKPRACVRSLGQIGSLKDCALKLNFGYSLLYLSFSAPPKVRLVPHGPIPPSEIIVSIDYLIYTKVP